jgi:hypothetical protein
MFFRTVSGTNSGIKNSMKKKVFKGFKKPVERNGKNELHIGKGSCKESNVSVRLVPDIAHKDKF